MDNQNVRVDENDQLLIDITLPDGKTETYTSEQWKNKLIKEREALSTPPELSEFDKNLQKLITSNAKLFVD